jgi:RNase P/RNase MRP subunit p29
MRSSSNKEKADVARRELIGLEVAVESRHAGWNGLSGTVRNETMNTFLVETASGREVLVPKAGQGFVFRVGDALVEIRGTDIQFRPEDRTKKATR